MKKNKSNINIRFSDWNVGDYFSRRFRGKSYGGYVRSLDRGAGVITGRSDTPEGQIIRCFIPLTDCSHTD